MPDWETAVTQKGQVTIPAEIRRALGLKPRDRVRFELEDGVAKLQPATSNLTAGYGAVSPQSRPEDFKRLREEFEQGLADDLTGKR